MATSMNLKRLYRIVILTHSNILIMTTAEAQQTRERTIERVIGYNEPVRVTMFRVKGRPVEFGQSLQEDNDWLRGLSLRVRNISDKPIAFIEVELYFPRPANHPSANDPPLALRLVYGRIPPPPGTLSPTDALPPLLPGQETEIRLPDEEHDGLRETLRQVNYPSSIAQVRLTIREVIFIDDTKWYMGIPMRRDPNDPSKWNFVRPPDGVTLNRNRSNQRIGFQRPNALFGFTNFYSDGRPLLFSPRPTLQSVCRHRT